MRAPETSSRTLEEIRAFGGHRTVVALDDDPTGTQTVRDVPVLTRWSIERLATLMEARTPLLYLLTNSRSLAPDAAARLAHETGRALAAAAERSGRAIAVVSRSDSTLRGHFPVEVDALAAGLGLPNARVLLAPFFGDGGRVTLDGVHYLRRGDDLVPVAETEFARDPVFGYRSSDLRVWVAERTAGDPRPVAHVPLGLLHEQGAQAVRHALASLPPRGVLVADSLAERDIELVALGVVLAEGDGVTVIGRTAASYVRARGGQEPAAQLSDSELVGGVPGLVVVGSHVPTTSAQLAELLADPPVPVAALELDVAALLEEPGSVETTTISLAGRVDEALAAGVTPVLHTSRALARGDSAEADVGIASTVSGVLVEIVRRVSLRPAWVLAKGGITSSDIATRALGVEEAVVLGPILPGVPTWRCGPTSRWPGMAYVVFPGNVGGRDAVRVAVGRLAEARGPRWV